MSIAMIWRHKAGEHELHWDLMTDRATVSSAAGGARRVAGFTAAVLLVANERWFEAIHQSGDCSLQYLTR